MTTIKASCPTCGEVELTPADVSLMVCSHAPLSYYAFCCPTCREEVRKPADTPPESSRDTTWASAGLRTSSRQVGQQKA